MSPRQVACDTGPILHLEEAQLLHLLKDAGEVHAPELVMSELRRNDPSWRRPAWLRIDAIEEPYASDAFVWQAAGLLDRGEAQAIALARQIEADWLLTDDAAARLFASELGFEVHGSLGIVLWAAAVGALDHTDAALGLDQLAASSLWISPRVLAEAHRALNQMFET